MSSVSRSHRRRRARQLSFSAATQLLLDGFAEEHALHDDIDAFHAPSECHALVRRFDEDEALREHGRSLKWWRREALRRGLSDKWCYQRGLPYPALSKQERAMYRSLGKELA